MNILPASQLSAAFRFLLGFDTHANVLLLAIAVAAFLLRRSSIALGALRTCTARPWLLAAALFPVLCLGSLFVYHDQPLSMDEYAALFQAKAFAEGRLSGAFPPELMDRLIPTFLQNHFLIVSTSSGQVSSSYWPAYSLLLAPFVWLGIPWAANPLLGALAIPALHRLAREVSGSTEAAGWAVAFAVASPAFLVASVSYYPLQAHLLLNLLYALLLVNVTVRNALLAGLVGSIALTLHNPLPHLLFCAAFVCWLAWRPRGMLLLAALIAGYLPLALLLGFGWREHLAYLLAQVAPAAAAVAATVAQGGQVSLPSAWGAFVDILAMPTYATLYSRLAGLSKIWTWGALGLLVFALPGYQALRANGYARVLAAALLVTFFGYFLVRFDQGHGWGYRYLHSAWFILPLLAGAFFAAPTDAAGSGLRAMAAWGIVLSLILACGLRALQVEGYIARHLAQVPPLSVAADASRPEVVFIEIRRGFYTHDLVQNEPLLRGPRIVMVHQRGPGQSALMANRFPAYRKSAEGPWGELWTTR
ncbi:MAG: hypothetical protein H7Y16_10610 [Candidatus Parcubacteria bacterium]|nr:hypothetical protein [Burkholderiales bacterium]